LSRYSSPLHLNAPNSLLAVQNKKQTKKRREQLAEVQRRLAVAD